jgi:hypothetical protein
MNFRIVLSVLLKMALGLVALCGIIMALGFWQLDPLNFRSPKDQDLISLFHDHRTAFDRLSQMQTKGERYISKDILNPEFKDLLSELHPVPMVTEDYGGKVLFIFSGGGLFLAIGPGWSKGIIYIPGSYERDGIIMQNLDAANKLPAQSYLRKIEPNWFIFYHSSDD